MALLPLTSFSISSPTGTYSNPTQTYSYKTGCPYLFSVSHNKI